MAANGEATPVTDAPAIEELVVAADSVLGLQIETTTSSDSARVEDPVEARVVRLVMVGGRVAIPEGTRVLGSVTHVERGGRVKGQGRLAVRFHTLVLADGAQVPLRTDPVFREGAQPGKGAAAKIGGAAIGGALLGAILGGGKGAALGSAIGAAGGTAATLSGDRSEAILQAGTAVTVRLTAPVTIIVDR
jgi:type IV secretory pathway VirB10-like protein